MKRPGVVGVVWVAMVLILVSFPAANPTQPTPIPLFSVISTPSTPLAQVLPPQARNGQAWVRNRQLIALNPAAIEYLRRAGTTEHVELTLNLLTAGTVTALVRAHAQGKTSVLERGRAWTGTLTQQGDSEVMLVIRGDVLVASIRKGRTIYEIKPAPDTGHYLIEIDAEALPSDHHPIVVGKEQLAAAESAVAGEQAGAPPVATDAGSTIDVMVVYTTAAKIANGGQNGIEALIDLGVSLANQALANSSVNTQFRLAHTAEVMYQESGDYSTDLNRLRNQSDHMMDDVHLWRDQYKADLVTLIEDDLGGICGVAYVMSQVSAGFANYAFSLTQDSCISGYTMAHEWGHNMGSQHDRQEGGTGAFPYSFGHKETGKFRTIMAYPCAAVCPRINHYSNPHVKYQGSWTTGVDQNVDPANSADNARAFTNALDTIANFRNSSDTTPPPAPARLRVVP